MKKIAFIKFAGLAAGGCEKYLQNIACILSNSQQFEVDYYYTNAAPYINWSSPFIHPDNDESRQKIMEDHQINLIKVDVQNKDGSGPPYEWINTNFWELFDEDQYDYSPVSLEAYSQIKNENNYFIIMGASEQHRKFAEQINCPHIKFIDFSSCVNDIHDFLGGIDVFAHARNDGEVCSAAIIEALYHGKPVISHPAMNMGHQEQIEGCGKMVYSVQEYAQEMLTLEQNDAYYQTLSLAAEEKYTAKYSYSTIRDKILQLYKT